jgi:hypothetical protein
MRDAHRSAGVGQGPDVIKTLLVALTDAFVLS